MSYRTLLVESGAAGALVTLNRPEKRNALSRDMIGDLLAVLDEVESSPARTVIIMGSGKAFCAGMDLAELRSLAGESPQPTRESAQRLADLFRRMYAFPKPVICAVNGPAVAGGCGIATLGDFTLASPAAKFGYPEVKIGLVPSLVSVFLRRQVGEKHARDLLLTGRVIDAAEAFRIGLVTEIVPAARLLARARELAASLVTASPAALARAKRLLADLDEPLLAAELAKAIAANAQMRASADFREGLAAFLEKRPAKWPSA